MRQSTSRRQFLRGAAALAIPTVIPASALGFGGRPAPSERIVMGAIGIGGQGDRDMRALMGHAQAQMVAVCDVDSGSRNYEGGWLRGLEPARQAVETYYAENAKNGAYKGCATYSDFRELLARDDIDAVTIATPDHWHAPIAVAAAQAGKDMYCQKPLSHTIRAGRAMVDAVERHGRIFQCGSQRRSDAGCRLTCEMVRNGRIGKLHTIHVGLPGGHPNPGYSQPETPAPVPKCLDWNMWLGPAPWAPYTHKRCHWTFRWILDYSGGQVTDWGAHFIDMAHWGMGTEETGPIEVEGVGEFPPDGELWNTATQFRFECRYANGMRMIVKSEGGGVRFEGTEGSLNLGEGADLEPTGAGETHLYVSSSQYTNFLDCVRSRQRTSAPVEVAHRSISPSHLGNIAMLTGRKIHWDPEREEILGDPLAARLLEWPCREPWSL